MMGMKDKIAKILQAIGTALGYIAGHIGSNIFIFLVVEVLLILMIKSFRYTYWGVPVFTIQFPISLAIILYFRGGTR